MRGSDSYPRTDIRQEIVDVEPDSPIGIYWEASNAIQVAVTHRNGDSTIWSTDPNQP